MEISLSGYFKNGFCVPCIEKEKNLLGFKLGFRFSDWGPVNLCGNRLRRERQAEVYSHVHCIYTRVYPETSYSKGCLKFGVCIPNLVEEREGKVRALMVSK